MYAFCTPSLPALQSVAFEDFQTRLDLEDASAAVAALVSDLNERNGAGVARVHWTQRIGGRSGEVQYSTEDVVSYFTVKTRSLKRKKLPLEINFKFGSADLTSQARATLDRIGRALQSEKLSDSTFRLGGHTDSIGSDEVNQRLSELRAKSARTYLRKTYNIALDRLEVAAFGEHLPKADNSTLEGRRDNRRLELEKMD